MQASRRRGRRRSPTGGSGRHQPRRDSDSNPGHHDFQTWASISRRNRDSPQSSPFVRENRRWVDLRNCGSSAWVRERRCPQRQGQRPALGLWVRARRRLVDSARAGRRSHAAPHCRAGYRNGSEIGARGEWSMAVRNPAVVVAAFAERGRADHVRLLPPRGHRRSGLGSPRGSAAEILVP